MSSKKSFKDDFEEDLDQIAGLSDADLEALMGGGQAKTPDAETRRHEPGDRVKGLVIGVQGDEILVELDGKTLGVIDINEFEGDEIPEVGDEVEAEYVQFDASKEACILSTKAVRTEVTWDQLHVGAVLEGTVTGSNRGGLTLDIKGIRAFMPISQIDRQRVEELEPYVGKKLAGEVTRVDRNQEEIVLSRRAILEREHEVEREKALASLVEGAVVTGRVSRVNQHGAFIDVGGVDGLLHVSKIQKMKREGEDEPRIREGQTLDVELVRIDREQGRIALDLVDRSTPAAPRVTPTGTFETDYEVGDEITGWITRFGDDGGAVVSIEEGVTAHVPADRLQPDWGPGTVIEASVTRIQNTPPHIWLEPR